MNELVVDSNTKLYKRSRSDNYYVAVKSYTQKNKYYRQSTKETELKNAKVKAKEIALNIFRNETVGNVVVEKTFNFVAKQFVLHTQNRFENKTAKKIEAEYVSCVEDKFCKFFGSYIFTAITQSTVEEYVAQRKKKISRSRQQTEQASWNALQKFAVNNNYANKQIDFVKVKTSEAKDRLDLTTAQQAVVRKALQTKRATKSKNKTTNEISELLYDYYYLLLHSAVRVGLEFMRLRYTSFAYNKASELSKAEQAFFAEADEKEYLVCYLKENETKTSKSRDVIIRTATNAFENALLRIASRTQHSADIHAKHYKKNKLKTKANRVACLKELFSKCDEYVLRKASEVDVNDLSEAEQLSRMTKLSEQTSKAFNKLLKEVDLYEDKNGNKRSLYSLRHTYATEMLEQTSNLILVAEQIGNSAVVLDKYYNKAKATTKASAFVGLAEQLKYEASNKSDTKNAVEQIEQLLKELKKDM